MFENILDLVMLYAEILPLIILAVVMLGVKDVIVFKMNTTYALHAQIAATEAMFNDPGPLLSEEERALFFGQTDTTDPNI